MRRRTLHIWLHRRALRRALLLLASPMAFLSSGVMRADIVQPRTSAREIQLLDPSEAAQAEPAHLRGVVTVAGGWRNSFFLQDISGGIAVNRAPGGPDLRPGDRVAVDGVTAPGDFAPMVNRASIRLLGHGPLPTPSRMRAADLAWGVEDSQWIEVEGEVRSVERKPMMGRPGVRLMMNLGAAEPTPLRVVVPEQGFAWESLTGATIRVRAVCATIWTQRRQFAGIRLLATSRADIVLTHAAPPDPYDVPFRSIGGLAQYSRATGAVGQVEVEGTVTLVEPKRGFFLQDASGAVFVDDRQEQPPLNAIAMVVGFPAVTAGAPTLQASRFQRVGTGTVAPRQLRSATEVVARSDDAVSTACDGMLLQTVGTLVDFTPGLNDATLFLKSDGLSFRAYLPRNAAGAVPWQRGSVLRLQGVCAASGDDMDTEGFLLRLRSAADVTVVRRAPWWTGMHALWLSGALGALTLGMLGWVGFLRRQARLRKLIATDALTGLYNRHAFLLLAEKQMETMRRRKSALLLFYFDLDDLKQINDTHGHRTGDAALKDVATLLRQVFRESDTLCRMGGDEFAALAVDATPESEAILRERFAEALRNDNGRSHRPFRIALSIGAVYYDHTCANRSIEDVLEHADARMYGNKRQRREAKLMPLAV